MSVPFLCTCGSLIEAPEQWLCALVNLMASIWVADRLPRKTVQISDHISRTKRINHPPHQCLRERVNDFVMLAPHRQSLGLTFFEVASPHDRPTGVAGKHPPARFQLVINIDEAGEPPKSAGGLLLYS